MTAIEVLIEQNAKILAEIERIYNILYHECEYIFLEEFAIAELFEELQKSWIGLDNALGCALEHIKEEDPESYEKLFKKG